MSVLSLPAGKGVQKGWSFVPNVSSIWDTQRVMSNDLRDHFPLGTAALQGQSPSLMCMVVFPVPDSAPGIYCVHHKLVALGSRPIRNKTSCCCQVREGKCTLCPEDYRPLLFFQALPGYGIPCPGQPWWWLPCPLRALPPIRHVS